MSHLTESLKSLRIIDEDLQTLSRRKQELKRQAWMTSGKTIGRARQLIAEATLSMLTQGHAVDVEGLELEIGRLASGGDRFALDLCEDWLDTASEATRQIPHDQADDDDVPTN
jgi:hypothetical protein